MTATETVSPPPLALTPTGDRPGRFGRVQLVAVELTVIVVAAAVFTGRPVVIAVSAVAALLLLAVTFGRTRRRWLYEAVAARRRLRRRRRAAAQALRRAEAAATVPDTRPGAVAGPGPELAALMPGLAIRAVTDRDTAIGVGQDELGWFAAVAIAPWAGLSGERAATPRLDRLARLLVEESVPVSVLQLATHRVAAPSAGLDARSEAAASYRELVGDAGGDAAAEVWLAVRLTPADAAYAAAHRGGGLAGVDRALAATLARVGAVLTSAGVPHRVLDAPGLRQALATASGLQRLAGSGTALTQPVAGTLPGAAAVAEQWAYWQAAGQLHACFAIQDWPAQPGPALLAELAAIPAATAVDTALVLRRPERSTGGLAVRGLLRVVAAPDLLVPAIGQLLETAGRLGVRLTRLDGEHGAGVYATAPTAATLGSASW
ncbi:type VII secretion protein EccE [Micromonospora sp. NPDC049559]|uniref:type VII secretion protein EccE n=1 Tax=Micromonospora sp. NPDC049559 TaxID=3155923 RepID=UPI00343B8356